MNTGRLIVRTREFDTKIRGVFVYLGVVVVLGLTSACSIKPVVPSSGNDDLPRSIGPIVNPKPSTSVALTAGSVDAFLIWVQGVPQSQTRVIREQIARGAHDNAVIDALAARLFEIPVQDIGRHLMILSILGETKNERAIDPLTRFVWHKNALVTLPTEELGPGVHTSFFNYDGGLRARAAEMLSYIGTRLAMQATRDVVQRHPSQEVRIAAIDAYLFQLHDSDDAKSELQRITQPDERKMIGLPRRTRDMDVKEFDARLNAFYERYPEERPPVPVQSVPDPERNRKVTLHKQLPESQGK